MRRGVVKNAALERSRSSSVRRSAARNARICASVLFAVLGISEVGAQVNAATAEDERNAGAQPIEEITVVGRRHLRELRLEVQTSKELVYDLFNSLNSREEFDIHCHDGTRTGTRTVRRVCRPQFTDDATREAAQLYLYFMRLGVGNAEAAARGHMAMLPLKEQQLLTEMQRLARENREFRRAIAKYQAVEARYDGARREVPIRAVTSIVDAAPRLRHSLRQDRIAAPRPVALAPPEAPPSEGWVQLRYTVSADGTTTDVRAVDAVPPGLSASGAAMAAQLWTFEAATEDAVPIDWHHNLAVVVFSRDAEYDGSIEFAEAYEDVAALIASGQYGDAKSRNELMQRVDATTLEEIALGQMQLAAIEHAAGDPHAALDAIRRATAAGVTALADEELKLALEHRFALELELGRAADALQTYERREELAHVGSRDALARQGAALKQGLAAPDATQAVRGRLATNGAWEYAPHWATFELSNVEGTGESLDVECHRRKAELPFEPNAQITIPPAWGACVLTLRGQPDTTFTLYEFLEPAPRIETD
jgi:hypothetical protein